MINNSLKAILGAIVLAGFAGTAAAEPIDPAEVFLSGRLHFGPTPFLAAAAPPEAGANNQLDYALFLNELVAFVTKEVISDSRDEYAGSSTRIPGRLSDEMPESRSEFGAHCLFVLSRVGSKISPFSGGPSGSSFAADYSPSLLGYAARVAGTALAVRHVWSAFRNDVDSKGRESEERSGRFSLRPKVSSSRVAAYVTFHW